MAFSPFTPMRETAPDGHGFSQITTPGAQTGIYLRTPYSFPYPYHPLFERFAGNEQTGVSPVVRRG